MWPGESPHNVYLDTQEVYAPHISPVDITRSENWTLVNIHPDWDSVHVIEEIARGLGPTPELRNWLTGFMNKGREIDIVSLHRNPIGYLTALDPRLLSIPCRYEYIPQPLLRPWGGA